MTIPQTNVNREQSTIMTHCSIVVDFNAAIKHNNETIKNKQVIIVSFFLLLFIIMHWGDVQGKSYKQCRLS